MKFYIACRLLKISPAKLIKAQTALNMPYYTDPTDEQLELIKEQLKVKKITSTSIAKDYNITMPTLAKIKKKLGISKGKKLSKESIIMMTNYLDNRPLSLNDMTKKYKISMKVVIRLKRNLGYGNIKTLNINQSKELEHEIGKYSKVRELKKTIKKEVVVKNNYTTAERCEMAKNIIDTRGYILSKEITKLFNGLHIQHSVMLIEKHSGIDLYDDMVKVLRYGLNESDDIEDHLKYKNEKRYMSQTALFAQWALERKTWNGHRGLI